MTLSWQVSFRVHINERESVAAVDELADLATLLAKALLDRARDAPGAVTFSAQPPYWWTHLCGVIARLSSVARFVAGCCSRVDRYLDAPVLRPTGV